MLKRGPILIKTLRDLDDEHRAADYADRLPEEMPIRWMTFEDRARVDFERWEREQKRRGNDGD